MKWFMDFSKKQIVDLAVDTYFGKSSNPKYTAEQRADGFHNVLQDLNKDYRSNKDKIFTIVEETVSEIAPKVVLENVKRWAEFKTFGDNEEVKFILKNGKIKAVEVALGGHVARQRIDKGSFTIQSTALQAKVYEEYERVIGGQVDWSELINLVINAINDAILEKVYNALMSLIDKVPSVNTAKGTGTIVKKDFDKIISIVKAYGQPVIMGTPLALAELPLDKELATDADKMDIRLKGYLGTYRGCSVVEIENSFEDGRNTKPVFDDSKIFIIPSGQERVIKVAMKGGMKLKTTEGTDWTTNFEAYQKAGVAVLAVNHIGIYEIV